MFLIVNVGFAHRVRLDQSQYLDLPDVWAQMIWLGLRTVMQCNSLQLCSTPLVALRQR